jgi:hypothetical protein
MPQIWAAAYAAWTIPAVDSKVESRRATRGGFTPHEPYSGDDYDRAIVWMTCLAVDT